MLWMNMLLADCDVDDIQMEFVLLSDREFF